MEGTLGPFRLVAGTFHGQLGGPDRPLAALGDLVGGGQRQRELVGGDRVQQRRGDRLVDGVGADRAAVGGGGVVGAGMVALVVAVAALVAGAHGAAAAAAEDDPLAQGEAFAGRAGPGVGAVGGQLGLDRQVVVPADVALVVVAQQHLPLVAGQLDGAGVHGAAGVDDLAGVAPAEHVRPGIDRIGQDLQDAAVAQATPAQLPG